MTNAKEQSHQSKPNPSHQPLKAAIKVVLLMTASAISFEGLAQTNASDNSSPTNSPLWLSEIRGAYSSSSEADIEQGGVLGSAEISRFEFGATFSLPSPDTWRFSAGFDYALSDLELSGPVPLPKELESFGFNFTAVKYISNQMGAGWTATAILNPTFSSDSGEFSGDSLNFAGAAFVRREVNPNLNWSFGVFGQGRGDTNIFPILGVDWKFSEDWNLLVGYPRTGISYQVTDSLNVTVGAMFNVGETYFVSDNSDTALQDTYMDYEEVLGGVRIQYTLTPKLLLEFDGGATIDRNFHFYERAVDLNGESAGYGRMNLRYRF